MGWGGFWRTAVRWAVAAAAALYAAILLIDPYDTVWFSPDLARAPVTTNQRFSFPALARNPRFDSAVVGTSTTRLLRPAALDAALGGAFVNLSMNSGTAYEQSRILEVFARYHPAARAVVIGIDVVWCEVQDDFERLTYRPFPSWMYDTHPTNDLPHLFNLPTLEEAGRQLAYLTGLRPLKYGLDGYTDFLPPALEYDVERARGHIYGAPGPRRKPAVEPPAAPTVAERASWTYATHALLAEMLGALPGQTLKILLIAPYHLFAQPAEGSLQAARWAECKRRLADLAGRTENTHVLDFMIESEITGRDENYWDPLHYSVEVADRLPGLIAFAVRERRGIPGWFDYLLPAREGASLLATIR